MASHAFITGRQNLTGFRFSRYACPSSSIKVASSSSFLRIVVATDVVVEQGLELGARAMIEAGAEMLFTSQPSPRSQLNIERNADGNVADQARVEEYIRDIHRQGKRHPL